MKERFFVVKLHTSGHRGVKKIDNLISYGTILTHAHGAPCMSLGGPVRGRRGAPPDDGRDAATGMA